MPTLEYVTQSPVSLLESKSSIQKSNDKGIDFKYKNFALTESEEIIDLTVTEIITQRIFKQRGFVSFENWDESSFISSRIIKVLKDYIHCECILSKESKVIQVREFPITLFTHISPLIEGAPLQIKISKKPGSVRTDIIDGKGLGIENDFEMFNDWAQLKDFENKPF